MQNLQQVKDKGNELFKQKNYEAAIDKFTQVITQLEKDQSKLYLSKETEQSKLYIIALINTAFASINCKTIQHYDKAISCCNKALAIDPKNVKGFYRRGLAKKEKAEKIEINESQRVSYSDLLQIYESAKTDFQNVCLIEKDNQAGKKNLSQVIKNIYRVTVAKGDEVDLTRGKKQQQKAQKFIKNPYQISADVPKKRAPDMSKILKEYKYEEVTSMVQDKVYNKYLVEQLPKLRSDFEKAIRTIQKSEDIYIQFVYRLSEQYLTKIKLSFDSLSELVRIILKRGQGEKAKEVLQAIRNQKSFSLYWKSQLANQKDAFRKKWVELGLKQDDLK